MRKSFTRLSSLLVLLLLSIQMVLAAPELATTGGLKPADGGTINPNVNPVFTMTFKANVQPGLLQIIGLYNSSSVETKAIQLRADQRTITPDSVYFTHPDGVVTFKGNVVKIKFNGVNWLALQNERLYVTVGSTAIQDANGGSFNIATPFDGGALVDAWDFTVLDLVAPTVKSLYPADNAKDVSTSVHTFAIHFKEIVAMVPGYVQGLGDFALYSSTDTSNVTPEEGGDLISLDQPHLTYLGGLGTSANFDSIRITWDIDQLHHDLPNNALLYVRVKPGIIKDLAGNFFAGINNNTDWNFTTKDDLFNAAVITKESHTGYCSDSLWNDDNFYIEFVDHTEELHYASTGGIIPNGADLAQFITVIDQNGVAQEIKTALFTKSLNKIEVILKNKMLSTGIAFTVTLKPNVFKDASGNLNKTSVKKFVAGNWDTPVVTSKRVVNQSGTTMDFYVATNKPSRIHYIVVKKERSYAPSYNEIFGHGKNGNDSVYIDYASATASDVYYRITPATVINPYEGAVIPAGKFPVYGINTAPYGKYYGKKLNTNPVSYDLNEIFAEGDITTLTAGVEVMRRINNLPATNGITDSPAAYYEIWFEVIDNSCPLGAYASDWWTNPPAPFTHTPPFTPPYGERISTPQVMDGSTVFTTDILMPAAWFDGDTCKVSGVLLNKSKARPNAFTLGELAKDGNIYINFNEPIRKFDGTDLSAADLKSSLWVYVGNTAPGTLDSDAGWSTSVSLNFTASLNADKNKIIIDPDNSWPSGQTIWVKIKNSKIEDLRGNEIVPYNGLYAQPYIVENYIAPLVRYTFGNIFTPLDSMINVPYKINLNTTVAPLTVTVSGKIYCNSTGNLSDGYANGIKQEFTNDTTKLTYIGKFFKIRKSGQNSNIVSESVGDPLELRDFLFNIDYNYGDSTKITITPKKQYASEEWYFIQIDPRIRDKNLINTIGDGAAVDVDAVRPKVFKLANALSGNATVTAPTAWVRASAATDDNATCVFKSEDSRNPVLTFFTKKQSTVPSNLVNIDGKTNINISDTIGVVIDEYVSLGFDHYIQWDALAGKFTFDANAMRRYFKVFDYDSVAMNFDVVGISVFPAPAVDKVIFYLDPYYVNADGTAKNSEGTNFTKAKSYWVYFNSKAQDPNDQGIESQIWGKTKGTYWDQNQNLVLEQWAKFTTLGDPAPACITATVTPAPSAANLIASSISAITVGLPFAAVTPLPCIQITEGSQTPYTVQGLLTPGNSQIVRFPVSFHSDSTYTVRIGTGAGLCGSILINSGNAAADQWPAEDCDLPNTADSVWTYKMVDETAPHLDTLHAGSGVNYGSGAGQYSDYLIPQDDECGFDKTRNIVMIFNEEVTLVPNKTLHIYDSSDQTKAVIYAQQCSYGLKADKKPDYHVIIVPNSAFGNNLEYLKDYHINIDNGFVTDRSIYHLNSWAGIWVADYSVSCGSSDLNNDWSFRTGPDPAPYFTEFSPANGTPTTSKLTMSFSEEVAANTGNITVYEITHPVSSDVYTVVYTTPVTSGITKLTTTKWEISGFSPVMGHQYSVDIPATAFKDNAGQTLTASCLYSGVAFDGILPIEDQTVESAATWYVNFRDAIAPYVINNWPRNTAKHVPFNAYSYIEFNEPIHLTDADGSAIIPDPQLLSQTIGHFITLNNGSTNVAFKVEFVGNNKRLLRITPLDPAGYNYNLTGQPTMIPETNYTVTLLATSTDGYHLSDAYGNNFVTDYAFHFLTEDITPPVLTANVVGYPDCTNSKFNFSFGVTNEVIGDTVRLYYAILPAGSPQPSATALFAQNISGAKQGIVGGKHTTGVSFTVDMGAQTEAPSFVMYAVARDCEFDIWTPASAAWDSLFFFNPANGYGDSYDRILDIMPSPNKSNIVTTTTNFTVADDDAPALKGTFPANQAVQVPVNSNVRFWFSEAVEKGILAQPDSITLRRFDNNVAVKAKITWPNSGDHRDSTFIIDPVVNLDQETKYYLEIDRYAVRDSVGTCPASGIYFPQKVGRDFFWFVTEDNIGPRWKSNTPDFDATCVSCPGLNADGKDFITVDFYDVNKVIVSPSAPDKFVRLYRTTDPTVTAWLVIPASSITVTQDADVDTLWHVNIPVTHQYYPNDPIQVKFPKALITDLYGNEFTNNALAKADLVWNYRTCNKIAPVVSWTVENLSAVFNYSYSPNPGPNEVGVRGTWDKGYRNGNQGERTPDPIPTHVALKFDFGEDVEFNTSGVKWEKLSDFEFSTNTAKLIPTELMSMLKVGDLIYSTTKAVSDIDTIIVDNTPPNHSVTLLIKNGSHAKLPVSGIMMKAKAEKGIDGGGLPYLNGYYKASLKSNTTYAVTVPKDKVRAAVNCPKDVAPRYVAADIVTFTTRDDTPPTVDFKNAAGQPLCGTGVCVGKNEPITISFSDSIVKSSYDVSWLGQESYTFDNLPLNKDDLRYPKSLADKYSHYFELCRVNKESATKYTRFAGDTIPIDYVTLGSDLMTYVVQSKTDLMSEGWYEMVFKKWTVKKYIDKDPSGTIYEGGDTCRFFVGDYVKPLVSYTNPADESTNVNSDTKQIVVVFNEGVKLGTGTTTIRRQDGSIFRQFTAAQATFIDKKTDVLDSLAFTVGALENFTKYYVEMPEGFITDDNTVCTANPFAGFAAKLGSDGLMLSADYWFMTSDSTAPQLINVPGSLSQRSPDALFPKVGSTVSTNSDLVMVFDENINIEHHSNYKGIVIYHDNGEPGSFGNAVEFIPWSNFYTHHADGQITISGSNAYDGLTSNVITINPNTVFDKKGVYYVRVNGDNIEDGSENTWSESTQAQLDPIKDREWYFSIVNDAAPVLVSTSPAYDGVLTARTYAQVAGTESTHGYVKADLSMTFKDGLNGDPIDVAPGSSTRMLKIFEYTYDPATAPFKSKPWISMPITDPSISFVGNVVTVHNVILRDGINGRGTNLSNDSVYYVTVDPGAIVNGLSSASTWWEGINNGFAWRFQTVSDNVFVAEPQIISPLNGAQNLSIDDANNLVIDFGEGIEKLASPTGKVQVFKVGVTAPVEEVTVTKAMITGKRLNVPLANIVDETNYYAQIQAGAFGDTSTVSTPNTAFGGADVWAFQTGDNTPPNAVTKAPTAGCVGSSATLTMTFNESKGVAKGTGTLLVKDPKGTTVAQVAAEDILISEDGNTVTALVKGLPDSTLLTVTVPAGFLFDKGNNVLPNPVITWTFTTGENTAPKVVITPDAVTTPDAVLTLTFSEVVGAVGGKSVTINGVAVDVDSLDSSDGIVYTYPLKGLSSETTYNVAVEKGAFIDINNGCVPNELAATADSFKVGDIIAPVATGSPKTAADYKGLKLTINFTEAVTPATGNIVIYSAATDLPIETIAVVASTTPVSVYTFESKNVRFGQYYILVDAGAFVDLGAAPMAQSCAGISSKTVWPLAIVDPSFDPCITISSMKPARAEKNVPTTTSVVITFCTERLAPGVGVVTIGDQSTNRVLGVNYFEYPVTASMISGSTLTIPVTGLQENTTYSIIIPYGAITDEAGNPFIGITDANSWIFTTGDFTNPVVSVTAVTIIGNDGVADPIAITSSEAGVVYLAKDDVAANATALFAAIAQKKAVAATLTAAGSISVNAEGLLAGTYLAYGFDASGRMGKAANFVTIQDKPVIPYSTIKQIQGQVAASPLAGQKVRTKGVVTAKLATGFYMQDANAEWGGIFVSNTGTVSVGSSVELIGTVVEVDGETTIGSVEGLTFIAPVITVTPLTVGPAKVMTENYEGVLVKVTGRVATSGTVTADWTISSTASSVYTINNALYGSFAAKKDYKYAVTGIGIPVAANYKVLAIEIEDLSTPNGINDLSNAIKVYPNPFDKFITLSVSNNVVITKAVITNIAGQLVKEVINPSNTIPTSELRSGVYFISLHTVDGIAKTERIIKR